MATLATINIKAVLDSTGVNKGIGKAQSALQGFASWAKGSFAAVLSTAAAGAFVGWGVKLAAEAGMAKAAFETMLGSADEATKMLQQLRDFARTTPFTFRGLQDSARTLLMFGVEGQNVLPILRMLGDVSGGNAERLDRLALAFGQMTSAGRLMGQDLLQMINAGFNPLQEISKRTGESMLELKKRMEAGGVSAAEVTQAFIDATSEGGRFFEGTQNQADTFGGKIEQLRGMIEEFAMSIGESLEPLLSAFIDIGKHLFEIVTPAAKAFLDTIVAMLMPTEGMPDIWETVGFWIELAGAAATNMFSVLIGGWRVVQSAQGLVFTSLQLGIAHARKSVAALTGETATELNKEIERLTKFLGYYEKVGERGLNDIQRGFTGEAGQEFVDRLNVLKDAARNSGEEVGTGLTMAATAAADTIKVAFKDINPGALERGSSGAVSAILKAQRDAEGNRTEKAMLKQLEAIARNTKGPGAMPANI